MDSIAAVTALFFAAALTPGPNNFLVMAAGARGGYARALPVIGGVIAGGLGLLTLSWAGVSGVLEAQPELRALITIVGGSYLAWMGVRMFRAAHAASSCTVPADSIPCTWWSIAAFQFLNPKAWVLLVTVTAVMSRESAGLPGFLLLATIYSLRSALTLSAWAFAGSTMDRLLDSARSRRVIDCTLGGLLVATAAALVVPLFPLAT